MSEAEEVKFHIKFVINESKTKVLFAEAGSDFADVLLSFLVMPLGTVVEVLEKHYGDKTPVIGSLNTLYKSAKNLGIIYFKEEDAKKHVINSTHFDRQLSRLRLSAQSKSEATFIISDDLHVLPIVEGSIFQTLRNIGIAVEDMDGAETRNVTFGLEKIIHLLKKSLFFSNPLSALIFPERQMSVKLEYVLLHWISHNKAILMNPEKMILKVILQKSTNKFLFAQADNDFVDFLLAMLSISTGKVEWFLGSNTGRSNIDCSNNIMHLRILDTKDYLINGARMYMVRDDLTVVPLELTSGFFVINEMNIALSDIREVKLKVGLVEGLSILQAALTSTIALTHGLIKPFLKNQEMEQ